MEPKVGLDLRYSCQFIGNREQRDVLNYTMNRTICEVPTAEDSTGQSPLFFKKKLVKLKKKT